MNGAAMYATTMHDAGTTDDLVIQHVPLVKRIAFHLMGRLPDTVLVDDLIQAGMLGLLEAVKNYDVSQGASFDTYAGIRIRGSMLDEVRRSDWTPRSVHKKSRMVSEAIREVENRLGSEAKAVDIAEQLGVDLDDYNQMLQDSVGCKVLSVEELAESGDSAFSDSENASESPVELLEQDDFQQALAEAIMTLPERERLVVALYYDEEFNLREIGEVLNVSESRVSQISSQAMLRLRARLVEWVDKKQSD